MAGPVNGYTLSISQATCNNNGGLITIDCSRDDANISVAITAKDSSNNVVGFAHFTGPDLTYTQYDIPALPDDFYTFQIVDTIDGLLPIQTRVVSCGPPPPVCDLVINSVSVVNADGGQSNGSITVNATGTGTIEYSLDGDAVRPWQSSPVFSGLPVGNYIAIIQKAGEPACGDEALVDVLIKPVPGCMDPAF